MEIAVLLRLACAAAFLAIRPKLSKIASGIVGAALILNGFAELMSRDGRYFALVGIAWLFVGTTHLLFLIPGLEAAIRRGATKG